MKILNKFFFVPIILLTLILPQTIYAQSDIHGHYFEKSMVSLIERGIMRGYSDGTYRPDHAITRAEFTVFLVRALNLSTNASQNKFTDIEKEDWYYAAITTAVNNQIIGGYPNNVFRPNKHISRQEVAAMMKRALDLKGIDADKAPLLFNDNKEINPMFYGAIQKLVYLNIIAGKKNNQGLYFAPLDSTTRGEMSAILNRMLQVIGEPKIRIDYTHYNYSFKEMIDIQVTKTPKVDGAGNFLASRSLVEYYANPRNFSSESSDYLQFLNLSENANLDPSEINRKVLQNKGSLSGQANSFIEAGKQYGINEVYLMAHALHETGNGTSRLATGIPVDKNGNIVAKNKATYTVYNMYGYGAVDNDPLNGGAKYAFNKGWFSPEAAIIGGARDIANHYINDGQDTLYKMRWNPSSPGYPQYATHVQWAILQTNRIQEIYNLLNNYVLKFDVPTFNQQPGATSKPSGDKQYHVDTKRQGEKMKTTANLNLRTGPTTTFHIIKTLSNNTIVTIIGENGGWYKVNAGGVTGWVSSNYLRKGIRLSEQFLKPSAEDKKAPSTSKIYNHLRAVTTENHVHMRTEPSTRNKETIIKLLSIDTSIEIIDKHDNWYYVSDSQDKGWISKDYILLTNLFQVENIESNLLVRNKPNLQGEVIGKLQANDYVNANVTANNQVVQEGDWLMVYYKDGYGWVHQRYLHKQNNY
ncbi:SH3 domain-containing protein [Virgibacillus salexigens]|uniref:SH3 domain-containing protein n=1 Tax=Virgibacillus salexigens TaxID=61016 RepID=UPI00190BB39E|nr:SH3 domain-containing protein [Virgibacillus salexigens]